jgi:hypothetical protein
MTERADQFHHDNAPAHSTALVQVFFFKSITSPRYVGPLQPRFGSLPLLTFPKAKISFEKDEFCECDCHTVHKLSQRRLTANWLAPQESDCSRMSCKVSSDWLPSYIKATRPVLEIFKMAGYFPDSSRTKCNSVSYIYKNDLGNPHLDHIFGLRVPRDKQNNRIKTRT